MKEEAVVVEAAVEAAEAPEAPEVVVEAAVEVVKIKIKVRMSAPRCIFF